MFHAIFPRRALLAIALAALAAAAVALVASSSSAATRHSPRVLKFISVDVGPGGGADVPPAGDSVGDIDTFKSVASDPRSGEREGLTESSCAIFDIAKPGSYGPPARDTTYHCSSITYLRGGLMTAVGSVAFDHRAASRSGHSRSPGARVATRARADGSSRTHEARAGRW